MGVKRGHAEEPPGGEEGKLKVTFHLGELPRGRLHRHHIWFKSSVPDAVGLPL